jgi:hypothetical protein
MNNMRVKWGPFVSGEQVGEGKVKGESECDQRTSYTYMKKE